MAEQPKSKKLTPADKAINDFVKKGGREGAAKDFGAILKRATQPPKPPKPPKK